MSPVDVLVGVGVNAIVAVNVGGPVEACEFPRIDDGGVGWGAF